MEELYADMCLTSYTPQKIDMNLLSTAAQILAICTKGPCKRRGEENQRGLPSVTDNHLAIADLVISVWPSQPVLQSSFFFFPLKDYLT